jgi:DNA-binding MarR family transcriptional regulator
MAEAGQGQNIEEARIMLGLLDSVERDGGQSQRRLASELGIALGLVNAYLKRCVKKGLLKASQAPARRYVYYLTPQGFAEKSRLTVEYLSFSFGFFRQAKADCTAVLQAAHERGYNRVALAGKTDLAEIAAICAHETGVEIIGVADASAQETTFVGLPVATTLGGLGREFDAVVLTDFIAPERTLSTTLAGFDAERVLIPELLRLRMHERKQVRE